MNCHNPSHSLNSSYIFFSLSSRLSVVGAPRLWVCLVLLSFLCDSRHIISAQGATDSLPGSPHLLARAISPRLSPPAQGTPGCVSSLCGRVDRFPRVLHLDKQDWDPSAPRAILLCRIILPATAWAILPSSVSVKPQDASH